MAASKQARAVGQPPYRKGKDPAYSVRVRERNYDGARARIKERLALAKEHGVSVKVTARCETDALAARWEADFTQLGTRCSRLASVVGFELNPAELAGIKNLPSARSVGVSVSIA